MKDFAIPTGPRANKPRLLMLSHCVPCSDKRGEASHRAWQLLTTFGRSHEIHLACLADGPVSLAHWRALHAKTKQIVIEPARRLRQWLASLIRMIVPNASESLAMRGLFRQPVREWSSKFELQAVLCTRLSLIDATQSLTSLQRIADLHQQTFAHDERVSLCDRVIISDGSQASLLASHDKRMILMPTLGTQRKDQTMRLTTSEELEPIAMPMPLKKAA